MELKAQTAYQDSYARPLVKGKFIFCNGEKYFIKGVTYGTFKPDNEGFQFPAYEVVRRDFELMQQNGINSVRTYTVPPTWLMDLAIRYNLKLMVGLPWEQHITFLDEGVQNKIIRNVKKHVLDCNKHPAILCYTIGNEIPASIVRWYGKKKVENFLKRLYNAVKSADKDGLVTYVNYPTTEYLDLRFLDFYSFNVYLESREKLNTYLSRLHNLCGEMPLVLAEIGMDSLRNGEDRQALTLEWQTKMIFGKGCAGVFIFAWTDEWWRGGLEITDWDFGVVDRNREAKKSLPVLQNSFGSLPFDHRHNAPSISVVVCSYNGSATISQCIEELLKLNYPNYEVIVVNDGSTDNLASIVSKYPVKLISTENRGLSSARNTGMRAARGEIIAYIDDDAYPDRDWLNYISYAFTHSVHAAIGGPNLVPDENGFVASCVGCSPGGPVHVLTTDEMAEHIPGCNMAIRKDALTGIGGFDHVFRAAGDDVDICWRLQQAGFSIGYHPSAVVWHHRRNSIKAYWRQQKGYGKAEALLEKKWPERYNALGHYSWAGSVYGNGNTLPIRLKKDRIFYGTWGSALFQSVYNPSNGFLNMIPLMPEWLMVCAGLLLIGFAGFWWTAFFAAWALAAACLLIVVFQAFLSAKKNINAYKKFAGDTRYILLTTAFHLMQPAARLAGRLKNGLTPWRKRGVHRSAGDLREILKDMKVWSEKWKSPEQWLTTLEKNLLECKARVKRGNDFDEWDLLSRNHVLVALRITMLIEEHGQGKQFLKLKLKPRISGAILSVIAVSLMMSILAALGANLVAMFVLFAIVLSFAAYIRAGIATSFHTLYAAFKNLEEPASEESTRLILPGATQKKISKVSRSTVLTD